MVNYIARAPQKKYFRGRVGYNRKVWSKIEPGCKKFLEEWPVAIKTFQSQNHLLVDSRVRIGHGQPPFMANVAHNELGYKEGFSDALRKCIIGRAFGIVAKHG
jgi:hypothetical protein